jgi:hypothetical protein
MDIATYLKNPHTPITPQEADALYAEARRRLAMAIRGAAIPEELQRAAATGKPGNEYRTAAGDVLMVALPLITSQPVKDRLTELATPRGLQKLILDAGSFLANFRKSGVELIGATPKPLDALAHEYAAYAA